MAAARALDGMEEPGMDTEAEAVATKAPACPLNCVEAKEGGEGGGGSGPRTPAQRQATCSQPRPSPLGTLQPRPQSATAKTPAAAQAGS